MRYKWIVFYLLLPLSIQAAVLQGIITDREGAPVSGANLQQVHGTIGTASDLEGRFQIDRWPGAGDSLLVSCLGYQRQWLFAVPGVTQHIQMQRSTLELEAITLEVQRDREQRETRLVLDEAELQQEIGLTLAETLEQEAGVSRRSMGPAPARPVLRGLSGDRLQLLEDGLPTGDLSATSADHAVAIEPLAAHGVVLLRGADALLYSPAVGGVVDVERGLQAEAGKQELNAGLFFDSASMARGVSARVKHSLHGLGLVADGALRRSSDVNTPIGDLDNSSLETANGGLGIAIGDTNLGADLSLSGYNSDYGIPGGFVGAHPNGVSIHMQQRTVHLGVKESGHLPFVSQSSYRLALVRYYHAEYESSGQLGIDFGVLSVLQELELRLCDTEGSCGSRLRASAEFRDFATGGLSHAPDTDEWRVSIAWLKEAQWGEQRLRGALRAEYNRIQPDEERVSSVVGHIRTRTFSGLSGALEWHAPAWKPGDTTIESGLLLQYAMRPPTSLELFSGGPHLAAYSYEIGNPEAGSERAFSLELPIKLAHPHTRAELNFFHTWYHDYLFPSFTGQLSSRRADLYEYRIMSRDARMCGAEFSYHGDLAAYELDASLSYVRGTLVDGGPLPEMPPLSGLLGVHHNQQCWRYGVEAWAALPQERVYLAEDPEAIPEARTAGWLRLDADLAWTLPLHDGLQRIQLRVENLLDQEYRQHLSRIRSVMPEAGRTFRLVWKIWL